MARSFAWRRLLVLVALFGLGVAAALLDWYRHPPITGADGRLLNMRNGPGDLAVVLELYAVEFVLSALTFQPWRIRPRPGLVAGGALVFAVWGILRWLIGLHSPTIMLGHDILMLVIALSLGVSAIVFTLPPRTGAALESVI